ncbi:MAG: LysM peptidoglycan-binding domain-containing protein [Bacteriovoracaceae bacterium]
MIKRSSFFLLILTFLLFGGNLKAQGDLELLDQSDAEFLKSTDTEEDEAKAKKKTNSSPNTNTVPGIDPSDIDVTETEEVDELEALKSDIGDILIDDPEISEGLDNVKDEIANEKKVKIQGDVLNLKNAKEVTAKRPKEKGQEINGQEPEIFDVGDEERKLLEVSKFIIDKIPENEWDDLATKAELSKYVVQEGDWLWKIAQRLFGSGFYYSKIWSLNPQITNPHEIEPGMVLIFDTGSSDRPPQVAVGEFKRLKQGVTGAQALGLFDWELYGDEVEPPWFKERQNLLNDGIFFQYASDDTYEDLADFSKAALEREYEKYEPPIREILIEEPKFTQFDDTGFDKSSRVSFDFKEGFFLNTFVTTNVVQDLGHVAHMKKESVFVHKFDEIYVKFDDSVKVKPGDRFSVYSMEGKVSHPISDRTGFRYTITAQLKVIRQKDHLWECLVTELTGIVQRKDRLTVFTPKINRIIKTFNKRMIEAAVIDSYNDTANGLSFGDVVYLDRGRADGVEMGNVFEAYSFIDRGTDKKITPNPTYKIGEITVISLSDNFSTGLITNSKLEIALGNLAITKTEEQAARLAKVQRGSELQSLRDMEAKSLDELDVELNLDNYTRDLLEKADQIQLTEDELEELERQEREKSVIKEHERDLRELERLEAEISEAEQKLSEKRVDEDKYLEQQSLEEIEKGTKAPSKDAFESLNEIENEIGRKYLDEDINAKENPYGLTDFDLEEIDELLNTESL